MGTVEAILLVTSTVTLVYLSSYIATVLNLSFLRYSAVEDPSPKVPDLNDEERRTRHKELTKAGFTPAGLVRERVFLFMDRVVMTTDVLKYRSADGKVYVSLYRLPTDNKVRVAATSYGEYGSAVTAATPGVGFEKRTDRTVRIEVRDCPVSFLLQKHAEAVDDFDVEGRPFRPLAVTLTEAAAREQAMEAEQIRGMGVCQAWWLFGFGWGMPAVVSAALLSIVAPMDGLQVLAAASLIGCVSYPVIAWKILPKFLAFADAVPDVACGPTPEVMEAMRPRRR